MHPAQVSIGAVQSSALNVVVQKMYPLRAEYTGKRYCLVCAKDHLELNAAAGIPQPAPVHVTANSPSNGKSAAMPSPLDPPGRLR